MARNHILPKAMAPHIIDARDDYAKKNAK